MYREVAAAKKPKVKQAPSRKSSRIAGCEAENEASELGLFVVNAECPRCGKVSPHMLLTACHAELTR